MATINRYANTELLKLPDCEGLLENGNCKWLNVTVCLGASCTH
ncbi:MAG: hypothetical protein Q8865_07340 [Bacillota bacterium]|nr:hypothetical protein [Bacillota bacterium]